MHVWHIRLDPDERHIRQVWAHLDPQERERALRLRGGHLQRRFIAAHGATRSILAGMIGCRPGDLRLSRSNRGKPRLAHATALHFNLSHARQDALLAICAKTQVGIDLEDWPQSRRRLIEPPDLAPILSECELGALATQPPSQRPLECLRLWVRKEALVKAQGEGLDEVTRRLSLPVPAPRRTTIPVDEGSTWPAEALASPVGWTALGLEHPGRWLAAIACAGAMPPPRLHAWIWPS